MFNCDVCGRETPVLTKMYVMRSDLSVKVCDECAKNIEAKNKLFAKIQLTCCLAVSFALVVLLLSLFIIIF